MAITPNSNLAGLSSKIKLSPGGKVGATPESLGLKSPTNTGPSTGVKAKTPGGIVASNPNTIKSTYTAPTSQQNAVSSTSPGSYKGTAITPGSDADVSAQIAKIDAPQSAQTQPLPATSQPLATKPIGSMGNLINNTQTPSFSGYVGALGNQQASPYNRLATGGILGTQGASQNTYGQGVQNAQESYGGAQSALQKLQELQNSVAQGKAAIGQQAIPVQFQQGRQQALQTMYGGQEQALASEAQGLASLYGTAAGQQATGIGGLGNSAGQALAGQGTAQSALSSAAGYAQPQLGSIGQVPFSPTDQSQGAILGSTQPGGVAGAGQLLGQFAGAQALGAAPYGAQAQNIQTQGTTPTNIAAQGATQSVQTYNQMNAANTQFENQASQLLNVLSQYQNNGSIPALNQPINRFSGALGSSAVSALNSAFAETQAAYTNLLSSSGGTPTSQDQQAIAALNINSTPQQIATSIQQLQAAAKIKLGAAQNLAQGYGSSLYGGQGQSQGGGTVQTSAGPVNTGW